MQNWPTFKTCDIRLRYQYLYQSCGYIYVSGIWRFWMYSPYSPFWIWRLISEVFSSALFHHTTVCSMAWFYRKLIHSGMSNNLNAIIWYSETYTINLTCLKCLLRQQSSDPYMFLAIWCSPVPTKYCHYSSLTK